MASATNSSALSDTACEKKVNIRELDENLKWSECCIYKVPCNLRMVKKEAYTPQLISIGPFHYGSKDKRLKLMQEQKKRYFRFFTEKRLSNAQALDDYNLYLQSKENSIRHCYAEKFPYISSKEFIDMLLLDAVFIMEHFMRTKEECKNPCDSESFRWRHTDDYIVTQSWLSKSIQRDLLLLENQLPMFVLKKLYETVFPDPKPTGFRDLANEYFANTLIYDTHGSSWDEGSDQQKVSEHRKLGLHKVSKEEPKHFTDLVRYFYLPTYLHKSGPSPSPSFLRTATKLQGAGVSFEVLRRRLLDIEFEKKPILSWFLCLGCLPRSQYFKARFQIPELKIDHMTECVFRNLIALEQCHYPFEPYICNYVSMIDSLIHTKDDVELLVEKKVIVHELGSDKEVATLVNGLCKHVVTKSTCYNKLMLDLDNHYRNIWNRAMAALRLVYFRDPWRASGTLVGIAVLVFTIFNFCRVLRVVF